MKRYLIVALAFFFTVVLKAQDAKKITMLNSTLSLTLPAELKLMSDEAIQLKYHKKSDANSSFYSDDETNFSMVAVAIGQGVSEVEMIKHKGDLLSQFAAKGYKLEENDVKKINGHDVIVVSFYSDAMDSKIYNKRFFSVAGGKLLMITFNCTQSIESKCKPLIDNCINSVEIAK